MTEKMPADERCVLVTRSLEIDLRNWLINEVLSSKNLKDCIDELLYKKLRERVISEKKRQDEEIVESEIEDKDLIEFIDYGAALNILNKNKSILKSTSQNILQAIKKDLELIKPIRDASVHGRMLMATQMDIVESFIEKSKKFDSIFPETQNKYSSLEKSFQNYEFVDFDDERESNHNLPYPDSNETGFVERIELNRKINKVINNYPVISFIGDAGTGKTALALRKCYEYLYQGNKFDVIAFHSFKTEKFSKGEIKDLKLEINSSEKFLSTFKMQELDKDPIRNLVKYMENLKVLLVLDNLETVLDHNITNFLDQFAEAEHNSKVFITSRVPVNRGDMVIKVDSFKDNEAMDFFRRLVNLLQLKDLKTLKETAIKKLIKTRMNNPLLIKLSLNAVADGYSIEEAFKPTKELLNFCYMNIFKKLDKVSKEIIKHLFFLRRELNISDICNQLENISPEKIQLSIRDLIRKNFIYTDFKKSETSYYNLRKEVLPFIEKNKFFDDIKEKNKIFSLFTQAVGSAEHVDININEINDIQEDWHTFLVRKNSDKSAQLLLTKVSNKLKRKENILKKRAYKVEYLTSYENKMINIFDREIDEILSNLMNTHQDYCEVYRSDGLRHSLNNDLEKMKQAFKKAISLQPDYPNIRNYYSERLRRLQDIQTSKENAEETLKLFPNNYASIMNLFLPKIFLEEFDESLEQLLKKMEEGVEKANLTELYKRKIVMRIVSYYVRKAEYCIKKEEYNNAINSLKIAFKRYEMYIDLGLVDYFTVKNSIGKARFPCYKLQKFFRGKEEEEKFIIDCQEKIRQQYSDFPDPYDIKREKIEIGGVYKGQFWRSHTNHLRTKGSYITFDNAYIEEFGHTRHKIFALEENIPKGIQTGQRLRFKVTKYFSPIIKREFIVAHELQEISDRK